MEIIVKDLSFGKYLENVDCHFQSGTITGITGTAGLYLLDLLNGDVIRTGGGLYFDNIEIGSDFYKQYPSAVAYVSENYTFYSKTVIDEFKFTCDYRAYTSDMFKTKVNNLLFLVGLDESYLKREIVSLSSSEKILLSLAINLIFDPKVIMFGDIFKYLDKNNIKKVISIINNLKESNKVVIFFSKDVNNIYDYSDICIIFVGSRSDRFGPTEKVYTSDGALKDKRIMLPSLVQITKLARAKKVNLSFHKDVRDIIKDVYKHV